MDDFSSIDHKIDPIIQRKIDLITALAMEDEIYQQMFSQLRRLERDFYDIEPSIPPEHRDKLWDFFGMSEAMTHRLLELACLYMEFPRST